MSCVHLKKLYELCAKEELRIGATDLVRLVCTQCGQQEVCPNILMEDYELTHPEVNATSDSEETAKSDRTN
jgi:hypothetical protein